MNPSIEGPCPKCQTANLFATQFCAFCGARLPWAAIDGAPTAPPLPVPRQTPVGKIVAIVLGSIAGCGCMVVLVVFLLLTVMGRKVTNTFDASDRTQNTISQP